MFEERDSHTHRSVEADVEILLEWLREVVGRDWAQATRVNTVVHVARSRSRRGPPWEVQRQAMCNMVASRAYHAQVGAYVTRLASWASWLR